MNDISIGAVGAALIAGLVSLLGLIIGKEQKVSEFRQAWIDELRKCLVSYLSNINSIADAIRLKNAKEGVENSILMERYKTLNEASHGIALRINPNEESSKNLMRSMEAFEALFKSNKNIIPENIDSLEKNFLQSSKDLLKFEWKRVKRGESTYVWTRRVVSAIIILMVVLLIYLWFNRSESKDAASYKGTAVNVAQSFSASLACSEVQEPDHRHPQSVGAAHRRPEIQTKTPSGVQAGVEACVSKSEIKPEP